MLLVCNKLLLRRAFLAGVVLLLVGLPLGCARWNPERWDLDHYRDERAVDIEKHLSREEPIIASPF